MKNPLYTKFCLIFILSGLILAVPGFTEENALPENKQTILGHYITSQEAYTKWSADPSKVIIVDVRTPEEYLFVGHAPMAHNIPVMLLKEKWYTARRGVMIKNPLFADQIIKKFTISSTLFLICRSGSRSAIAVNMLATKGFKNVFTITDGFEGAKVKNELSYFKGKRMVNGWKNSGAPWTYKMNRELTFNSVLKE